MKSLMDGWYDATLRTVLSFLFWLTIALALIMITLRIPGLIAARQVQDQALEQIIIPIADTDPALAIELAYPTKVLANPQDAEGDSVSAWLIRLATGAPPTENETLRYVVVLDAPGLDFVSGDGLPTAPHLVLVAATDGASRARVFLRPASIPAETSATNRTLTYTVYDAAGGEVATGEVDLALETREELHHRQIMNLLVPGGVLLSSLATLIGLSLKLWQKRAEEQREEEKQRHREAMAQLQELKPAMEHTPGRALSLYLDYRQRDASPWTDREIRDKREAIWANAPEQLRHFALLVEAHNDERSQEKIERLELQPETMADALNWAYRTLSRPWKSKSVAIDLALQKVFDQTSTFLDSEYVGEEMYRRWRALTRAWPTVARSPAVERTPSEVEQWLSEQQQQGKSIPFGAENAENDLFLFYCKQETSWMGQLLQPEPGWLIGGVGCGKTGAALLATEEALRAGNLFPVYARLHLHQFSLRRRAMMEEALLTLLANAASRSLFYYLADQPGDFVKLPNAHQVTVVFLWRKHLGLNLTTRLSVAGLGDGEDAIRMGKRVEELEAAGDFDLSVVDLIRATGMARPAPFKRVLLLVDVQQSPRSMLSPAGEIVTTMVKLQDSLALQGTTVKFLLPPEPFGDALNELGFTDMPDLRWQGEAMEAFFRQRLNALGMDTLATWCKPQLKPTIDEHVLAKANGNPRRLIKIVRGMQTLARPEQGRTIDQSTLDDIIRNATGER